MLGLVDIDLFGMEKILKRCQFFFTISKLSLGKGVTLYLNRLESPSPKNDFCQVGLKLARRLWRKNV